MTMRKTMKSKATTLFGKANKLYKEFSSLYNERRLGAYSARAAFFMFISLFPFCALLFGLLRILPNEDPQAVETALSRLPGFIGFFVREAYASTEGYSSAVIPITVLFTLYSASKGMYAVADGLDSAYGTETRKNAGRRIRSMIYTLAFILLLTALSAAGFAFLSFATVLSRFITRAISALALLAGFTGVFVLLYKFLPDKRLTFRSVIPGAVVSGIGWVALTWGYSLYISLFMSDGSTLYGSLSAVVLLMFWLEACMSVTLVGGLINLMLTRRASCERKHTS